MFCYQLLSLKEASTNCKNSYEEENPWIGGMSAKAM